MRPRVILSGVATFLPGYRGHLNGTGGTTGAPYCYGVWRKHLAFAWHNGLRAVPRTVAEIGPGDSLGTGLAALLSGAETYDAFDVVAHAPTQRNAEVLEGLIDLFREQPYAEPGGWPDVLPILDGKPLPPLLSDDALAQSLVPDRLDAIRRAVRGEPSPIRVRYVVPWHDRTDLAPESVDFLFSHSLLEHVDDLAGAYAAMFAWVRPGGMISHQIDFGSHGITRPWNGHWALGDVTWRLIRGRRPYLINRQVFGDHLRLIEAIGFRIVYADRLVDRTGLPRERLGPAWRNMSSDDLVTRGGFVQAVKPG